MESNSEEPEELKDQSEHSDSSEENQSPKLNNSIAIPQKSQEEDPSSESEESEIDLEPEIKKALLKVLNRLSDGNMDPMFKEIYSIIQKYHKHTPLLSEIYSKLFLQMCMKPIFNSAILSVNCFFLCVIHRMLGPEFFAPILKNIVEVFTVNHHALSESADTDEDSLVKVKNAISMFTHFYLFESITHTCLQGIITDLIMELKNLGVILNLFHNVGSTLRKQSPEFIFELIERFSKIKTNAEAEARVNKTDNSGFMRKLKFISEELDDIRNNKIK